VPKVRDVQVTTEHHARHWEAAVFMVVVPEGGGLQVAFAGNPSEAVKMPALLRHLASEMEQSQRKRGVPGRLM
jgi:hypothetical protein